MAKNSKDQSKQQQVDQMGETLFDRFAYFVDRDFYNAKSIQEEWIVDGRDPEDGEYRFLIVDFITEDSK